MGKIIIGGIYGSDELQKYNNLLKEGAITQEEYDKIKAKLLASMGIRLEDKKLKAGSKKTEPKEIGYSNAALLALASSPFVSDNAVATKGKGAS